MKVTTFTDLMIRKLKPEGKKYARSEGNGFTIRVMPSGTKTWLYVYAFGEKRREMNLGGYPDITLEKAREKFKEARRKVKNGADPLAEQEHAADELRKAPTVKMLCSEYIERHAKKFKRTWKDDVRVLNHDIVPAWGGRKAADISKRDVVLLLEKIVDRGAPIMANNTFAVIRKMFNFAVEKDILQHTPCIGVKNPAPKVARERVLSEAEVKDFWNNLDLCSMSAGVRLALKLILVTAQRPGEVAGMHTREINEDWWTIPGERVKNKKTHRVPLSPLALEIIAEALDVAREARGIPEDQQYSGFVFPTPSLKKVQPIAAQALVVALGRALASPVLDGKGRQLLNDAGEPITENVLGVDKFTPHDLRRTAATFMAEAGEMDEVIDAVQNHAKIGVIKVYNQFKYDKPKQLALQTWARKLLSLTSGTPDNVVPIRRKVLDE
jgi:integrase